MYGETGAQQLSWQKDLFAKSVLPSQWHFCFFFPLASIPPLQDPSPALDARENEGAPANVVEGVLVHARRDLLNLQREAMWQSANDSMALAAEEAAAAAVAKHPSWGLATRARGLETTDATENQCPL